jgi:hypothetical protein
MSIITDALKYETPLSRREGALRKVSYSTCDAIHLYDVIRDNCEKDA